LICGSNGWYNYRHQADLLYVYQTLKAHDFTDDDIILIMRDDIAYHSKNKYPGVIKASEDGENLYRDVVIDYRADTLGVKDIEDILVGNKSARLATVLESTEKDNVMLYWTGHGTNQAFSWLDTGEKFTDRQMERTIRKMYEDKKYLSMLIFTEPCYSGSVIQAIEGIPLVLGITAADNNESSFAENYSDELGVWMCDRFTLNLMRIFAENPYIDLLDAFKLLNASTIGSHVQVYNSDEFYYLGDCLLWSYFKTYNE
jgi:glycosylphosphatidylinositol transamidase (GPIT) subunit GPI8